MNTLNGSKAVALVDLEGRALQIGGTAAEAVALFLAGKSPRTVDAYRLDLSTFAAYVGAGSLDEAAADLLGNGPGHAQARVLGYRAALLDQGLSPATVNRRLAAVRSLVSMARTLGLVAFALEIPGVKTQRYRDTRGPGLSGFRVLLEAAAGDDMKARRDTAVLRLLWDLALRRAEVVALDLEHYAPSAGTLSILGKGRRERETLTLPPATKAALDRWIALRGTEPGPLIYTLDHRRPRGRLTGVGLWTIVRRLSQDAGIAPVRPHGLRHAAITAALDATQGDVRRVQRFSRHRDIRTLGLYDDNRSDLGGEVAALVAGIAGGTP